MASKRIAILAILADRLATIQTANGFTTDAGLTILFGESPMFGPDDPTTAVDLVVSDDDTTDANDDIIVSLPVSIQAFAPADAKQPWLTVEAVISDIKKAIELTGPTDRSLGGLLSRDLLRGRTRPFRREAGSLYIGASVVYTAIYLDAWGAC